MPRKAKSQKSLDNWTAQNWRTSDGKKAQRAGGTTRYLPDAAWEQLTPAQRAATNRKKQTASRKGKSVVANTSAAKKASRNARSRRSR